MYEFFKNLDRRWIFLMMFLAVSIPMLLQFPVPEKPSRLVLDVFDAIEELPKGSKVLLAFDYDPASEGELGPMATAFARHCCEKGHKMYFLALWPVGPQMIDNTIDNVIKLDYKDLKYGEDYVNLGFKPGNEGVIKVIVTNLRQLYTTDHYGTSVDDIDMMRNIKSVQDMDLILNVSAGFPGTKEWVQYAATPFPNAFKLAAGCTGVQAPLLYPYIPDQLVGLLGAIKGAAEYEAAVEARYPLQPGNRKKYQEGQRRMGPQLVAHLFMIFLIVSGNVIFFVGRARGER